MDAPQKLQNINTLIRHRLVDGLTGMAGMMGMPDHSNITSFFNPYVINDTILRQRINSFHDSPPEYAKFVPQWLLNRDLYFKYEKTDYLHQLLPLEYLHDPTSLAYPISHPFAMRSLEEERKRPGEHLFHQTIVMIVGHWIILNHYVNSESGSKRLLVDTMSDLLRIPPNEGCSNPQRCVLFAWQLLALLHDIGYRISYSYEVVRYFVGKRDQSSISKGFLEHIFPQMGDYIEMFQDHSMLNDIRDCFQYDPELHATWNKYIDYYSSSQDLYSFFYHQFYGVYLIKKYMLNFCGADSMPDCMSTIYKYVVEGIALHHLPFKRNGNEVPYRWVFRNNPLAYLLRIIDEVKFFNVDINRSYFDKRESIRSSTDAEGNAIVIDAAKIRVSKGAYEIEIDKFLSSGSSGPSPLRVKTPYEVSLNLQEDTIFPVIFERLD